MMYLQGSRAEDVSGADYGGCKILTLEMLAHNLSMSCVKVAVKLAMGVAPT